jgi:hypothetical protein
MEKPYVFYSTGKGALAGLVGVIFGMACGYSIAAPLDDFHPRLAGALFVLIAVLSLLPSFWIDRNR